MSFLKLFKYIFENFILTNRLSEDLKASMDKQIERIYITLIY